MSVRHRLSSRRTPAVRKGLVADCLDDDAMFIFAVEQVARMHSALRGLRRSLG